jgi:hypothetical protein
MRGSKEGLLRCIYLFASICGNASDTKISVACRLRSQSWFDQYRTQEIYTGNNVEQGLLSLHAIHSNLAYKTCLSVLWEEFVIHDPQADLLNQKRQVNRKQNWNDPNWTFHLRALRSLEDRGWDFFTIMRKAKCSIHYALSRGS